MQNALQKERRTTLYVVVGGIWLKGAILIVFGIIKAYKCGVLVVALIADIDREDELAGIIVYAIIANGAMALIGVIKAVGGIRVFWIERWAMWVAILASGLHIGVSTMGFILALPIILDKEFEMPPGLSLWHDASTVIGNLFVIVALLLLFRWLDIWRKCDSHLREHLD